MFDVLSFLLNVNQVNVDIQSCGFYHVRVAFIAPLV
jgi:hypothetical protein